MSSIISSSSLSILSMDLCFGVQSTTSSFISSNSSSSSSMAVIELVLSDEDDNDNDNTQTSQPSQPSKSSRSSEKHSSTQSLSDNTYGSNSVAYIHYNVPRSSNPFTTKQSIPKPAISNPFALRTPSISISPTLQNSETEKIAAYGAFYNEQKSEISSANKSRKDKLLFDLSQPPEKTLKQKIAESRIFFGVQHKHGLRAISAKNMRPSRPKPPNHRFNYFTNMVTSKSDAYIDGEDDEYPALMAHNIKSSVFVKSGHKCHVSYFSWDNDKMVNDILLGGDENKRKFCFV